MWTSTLLQVKDVLYAQMRGRSGLAAIGLMLIGALSGCPSSNSSSTPAQPDSSGKMRIVATTGMVGDLVRQVVGDRAEVVNLVGEGIDPHLFRPTAQDVGRLMKADVVVYSGLMLEGAMQSALEQAKKSGKRVVAVTEGLPEELLHFAAEFEGHPDPHVWNDVGLWSRCVGLLADQFAEWEPEQAGDYQANAERYQQQLAEMDQYAKQAIATIPENKRYLVTAHDAFHYFSKAYGIEVHSVQGITTDSEPGVQDINRLVDFLVTNEIPSLFVEATVNQDNLRAVIEGAASRGWTIRIGGVLYSDSMGTPGTYEGTYLGMIDHNVTTIVRALQGEAPERGLNGKLSAPVPVP